jgi:hypothetical protein
MAAIHAGLVAATLVQGKGFSYQVWLAFPLCLFWTGLFLDGVVARVWASRGEGERRPSWLAAAAIVFLAIGLPAGNGDLFKSYGVMLADPGRTQGNLAPLWDQTVTWLRANVGARERVFFFGHDPGVSFLMRLPPVTRTVALDLQDDKVNAHPLMAGRKQRMMEELAQAPPDWILVATYDGSWLTKNGIESLKANRPLLAFLHDRYERVPSTQTAYWVFHRQPTEARIPAASPMGSPGP